MNEVLTIEEIKARFAPDWVLIGDIETDEGPILRAGRVLFHSPDRDEVYRKVADYPEGRYAFRYLGPYPENMEFVL